MICRNNTLNRALLFGGGVAAAVVSLVQVGVWIAEILPIDATCTAVGWHV